MTPIQTLQTTLLPLQEKLYNHPMYKQLNTLESLQQFMAIHVFVVWDFMNLLTALQQHLTSTTVPWSPPKHPKIARFINEIKLEEESDIIDDTCTSHFDYYVNSMENLKMDTTPIHTFKKLILTTPYESLITHSCVPKIVQPFLAHTYQTIQDGPISTAASFTFGRETLIPNMFIKILNDTPNTNPHIRAFKTYLERHIELDGNVHGQIALSLINALCGEGDPYWHQATQSACAAIQARIDLYDGISSMLA